MNSKIIFSLNRVCVDSLEVRYYRMLKIKQKLNFPGWGNDQGSPPKQTCWHQSPSPLVVHRLDYGHRDSKFGINNYHSEYDNANNKISRLKFWVLSMVTNSCDYLRFLCKKKKKASSEQEN